MDRLKNCALQLITEKMLERNIEISLINQRKNESDALRLYQDLSNWIDSNRGKALKALNSIVESTEIVTDKISINPSPELIL